MSVTSQARLLLATALSFISAAWGQSTFSTITGNVTDPTGASVPAAVIEALHVERNHSFRTATNDDGQYTVANLPDGAYTVTVKAAGFQEFKAERLILAGRDIRRVDAQLQVGAVGTTVEVQGGSTLIETETASVAGTKDREILRALPLTLRRAWDYFTLTPTIERTSAWSIRFGGTGTNQGESTLDGTTLATAGGGPIGPLMDRTEQVQEMRVDIAQASAEHSTMGQIALISRSGTNDFHGTAADYFSDTRFNSRNPFNLTKGKGTSHQIILSAGGPVYLPGIYDGRNRTFFFSTIEIGFNSRGLLQVSRTVPLASWRQGDFSNLSTPILDPTNSNAPFPGNRIPAGRLNPVSLKYQDRFIPLQNFGDPNALNTLNFRRIEPGFQAVHQPAITHRLDHRISDRQSIYGRITYVRWNFNQPETNFPELTENAVNQRNMDTVTVAHTFSFSPTLMNEFRYGLGLQRFPSKSAFNGTDIVSDLGLQGLAPNLPEATGIPRVTFTGLGLNSIESSRDDCDPCNEDRVHSFINDVSWFRGKHNWKFGTNVRLSTFRDFRQATNTGTNPGIFGRSTFSNRFTGHTYADFILGYPTTLERSFPAVPLNTERWSLGFYATDTWKPTPKLTLTLGLRWDAQLPWKETNGRMAAFDVQTGRIVIPDGSMELVSPLMPAGYVDIVESSAANLPSKLVSSDLNNFQPRVGIAWRPFGSNTVFRGGFGLAYNIAPRGVSNASIPFLISEPAFTNPASSPLMWPAAFPSTGSGGPSTVNLPAAVNPNLDIARVIQYSATIEHQRWDTGFMVSYIGTGTRQGVYRYNVNQPLADGRLYTEKPRLFPRYPDILYADNGAGHQYHGVTLQAQRKMKNGFYYQAFYTLAKDMGDLEDGETSEDAYNRRRERAWWERMPLHRFSGNTVYELPVGRGKSFLSGMGRFANAILGGWRVSAIVSLETGRALTPLWTGPDPTGTRFTSSATRPNVTLRPDVLRDPNLENPTVERWYDVSAFGAPPIGRFGNSAKGVIVSPGTAVMHNALSKDFLLFERVRMRFEVLANNSLNHPNWSDPQLNISNAGTAGQITAVVDRNLKFDSAIPRVMQLHLRFEW